MLFEHMLGPPQRLQLTMNRLLGDIMGLPVTVALSFTMSHTHYAHRLLVLAAPSTYTK